MQDFRKFLADAELIDGVHLKQSNVVSFFTRFATAGKDATLDPYQVCLVTRKCVPAMFDPRLARSYGSSIPRY